ncbi:MAG TPA: response regulator [Bacteroidetes bacterium]|nr:response regulator [Bacteroidota bacterium]
MEKKVTTKAVEILLVEDNPHDAELAMRALKKSRLANRVVHVSDGEQALDFLFARGKYSHRQKTDQPKMILLDLKLPRVDGMEVLKAVKSNPRTRVIPIVVLTSSREERDIIDSYELGVNSYLVKPVDFDKFVEVVKDLGMYWLVLNQPPRI